MQTLQEQIDADLKQAMRDQDTVAKLVLRSVKTALTETLKDGKHSQLDDEQTLSVVQKEAKRRRDAAAEYNKLNQTERAQQEYAELKILEQYLPRQLESDEIKEIVRAVITDTGATSMRDMGKVMSAVMAQVSGRADGKQVNQIVRNLLNS